MRKIILPILLIILTLLVILIPPFLSGQNQRNIADETTYRDYNAGKRTQITSEEVAKLYSQGEISIDLSYTSDDSIDKEIIRKDISGLIDMLFSDNQSMANLIKNVLSESEVNCFRNSSLIKIDNRPTAINILSCGTKNEKGYIEIDYEEKTKTILQFSCYIFYYSDLVDSKVSSDKADSYVEFISTSTSFTQNNYYKDKLNLGDKEYYFDLRNVVLDEEADEGNQIARFYVYCGIARQNDGYVEKVE